MSVLDYRLELFPDGQSPEIGIAGRIARDLSAVTLEVELTGNLDGVLIDQPEGVSVRRDGLWQGTCLELFLTPAGSRGYWEFNVSPAGHWNVYRFSGCRMGMTEEEAFGDLSFDFVRKSGSLRLSMAIDLSGIVLPTEPLHAAVCAVVKHRVGALSYWALTHCGPRPDFHRRESFILVI